MRDLPVPYDLDHVEMTGEVSREVDAWVLDGKANAGLRTEMDDAVETFAVER